MSIAWEPSCWDVEDELFKHSGQKTMAEYYGDVLIDQMFRIRERAVTIRIHPENRVELVCGDFSRIKLRRQPFRPL